MEGFLKLSTNVSVTVLIIDSADHLTGKTGLSAGLTIYATKAAGTPATITPTVTELDATNAKGLYKLALTTSHTDTLGELQLHITGSGMDPLDVKWEVATYLPGEAATLQTDQAVNTTKVGGTSQTGRDLGASVIAASISSGGISAASFAAGAIDAAAMATDAITSAELATSAVTEIVTAILTTAMTEAYAADGAAPTLAQILFMVWSRLAEFTLTGTAGVAKGLDGSTTKMTFTTDSATAPTSITRTT